MEYEFCDVYDRRRHKTGKIIKRGERLEEGEYQLIVHVWIKNSKHEFLIQQRSEKCKYPLVWSATGGNVISGETSLDAAFREVEEELGIDLTDVAGGLFDTSVFEEDGQKFWCDSYLYFLDLDVTKLNIYTEEVKAIRFEKMSVIKEMMKNGEFFVYNYLDELEIK